MIFLGSIAGWNGYPYKTKEACKSGFFLFLESARRESNPRPSPWQGDIVPLYHSRIFGKMPRTGIEPVTRGFSVLCSTDWAIWAKKAGDGNRTHVFSLEGWHSTIELHPHITFNIFKARMVYYNMDGFLSTNFWKNFNHQKWKSKFYSSIPQ